MHASSTVGDSSCSINPEHRQTVLFFCGFVAPCVGVRDNARTVAIHHAIVKAESILRLLQLEGQCSLGSLYVVDYCGPELQSCVICTQALSTLQKGEVCLEGLGLAQNGRLSACQSLHSLPAPLPSRSWCFCRHHSSALASSSQPSLEAWHVQLFLGRNSLLGAGPGQAPRVVHPFQHCPCAAHELKSFTITLRTSPSHGPEVVRELLLPSAIACSTHLDARNVVTL